VFLSASVFLALSGVATGTTAQDLTGMSWVKFGRDSIQVAHVDDSVTIVLYVQTDASGPITLYAQYGDGGRYLATDAKGVAPGKYGVTRIPWRSRGLTIGRSRQLQVESGDILAIRYPTDYGPGGWLARN
jgi:hypothetical protein